MADTSVRQDINAVLEDYFTKPQIENIRQTMTQKEIEQLRQELQRHEFWRPNLIPDKDRRERVLRSYAANNDPFPEDGEGIFEVGSGERRMRSLRRASIHGRPGMKPSSANVPDASRELYESLDRDINSGPYPESSNSLRNLDGAGRRRKTEAKKVYKKYHW